MIAPRTPLTSPRYILHNRHGPIAHGEGERRPPLGGTRAGMRDVLRFVRVMLFGSRRARSALLHKTDTD
jgi:hypothetical protein